MNENQKPPIHEESSPVVDTLVTDRRVECCGAHWDSKVLKECPRCDATLKSQQNANVDLPDTAAQDFASKSNSPAVSG